MAISLAIQKIASDCGCDAMVHLVLDVRTTLLRGGTGNLQGQGVGEASGGESPCTKTRHVLKVGRTGWVSLGHPALQTEGASGRGPTHFLLFAKKRN